MHQVWAAVIAVLVLLSAASYEAAIALGWLAIGPLPGEGRRAEEQVFVAVVAQLVGAVLAASYAFAPRIKTAAAASMIQLAAAAFMTACFYSFDPYYAPTLRRMSDGGIVAPWWVFMLVGCSLVAGALTRAQPRVGFGVVAVVVPLCAFTAFAMGVGH